MSLRRALTDPTSSVNEAAEPECLSLFFDCLTSYLRVLARKIRRGAPLDNAVIVQTALECLDLGFPFRRQLPVEYRRAAICAHLGQEETGRSRQGPAPVRQVFAASSGLRVAVPSVPQLQGSSPCSIPPFWRLTLASELPVWLHARWPLAGSCHHGSVHLSGAPWSSVLCCSKPLSLSPTICCSEYWATSKPLGLSSERRSSTRRTS